MDDLLERSALEQAALIRDGRISSEELTRFYLDRIARHDPRLSAFVTVMERAAIREARARDEARRAGRPGASATFHGVPTGVKDLDLVKGTFARMGSRAYRYFWSPVDGPAAKKLRAGGFVITGKLSASEIGAMPVTEPDIHPPTRNPWDTGRSSGGSSGGSGAAVAAGLLPIAQGSDGAGSIRIPSAFCGLYGIKPSRGQVENPYARTDTLSIAAVGPLARTVDDAAAMLDVLRGLSRGGDAPRGSYLAAARQKPRRLKIRFTLTSPLGPVDPPFAEAVVRTAKLLSELGHDVEESPPLVATLEEILPIWQRHVADVPVPIESVLQPITRWLRQEGRKHDAVDVVRRHRDIESRILEWYGDADLRLTPTVPAAPPEVGVWRGWDPEKAFLAAARYGTFTALFNLTGQPAASVPAGLTKEGLPIGIQLAGRRAEDDVVLAVSKQLEDAMPWRGLRPKGF